MSNENRPATPGKYLQETGAAPTAMNDTPKLKPRLRFPEFREAEDWKSKPMREVYTFKGNNSLSREKLNYVSGSVKNIHYGDIHTKFSPLFDITKETVPYINSTESLDNLRQEYFCAEKDMIFADASEDLEDVGKSIEIINLNNERVVSGLHTILARQINDDFVIGFGGHLFKCRMIRAQIQKESQGAKVLGISATRLANINLLVPLNEAEQQKIAACLSTLDATIAAHARQLAALGRHKKALMQQLFPREGETQPRLRFPEFRDAGDWETKEVGEVFKVTRGEVLSMKLVQDVKTNEMPYPVYSSQTKNNGLSGYYSDYLFEDAITWTTDGANAGDVNFRVGKFYCTNVCGVLLNTKGFANPCTAALINSVARNYVSYVGNPKLMNGVMSKISIPFPSVAEQQKIAACLSTLDACLAAQAQKLAALQQHKRGLMQGLFPDPAEDGSTPAPATDEA